MRIFKKILPVLLLCSLQACGQIGNYQYKTIVMDTSIVTRGVILKRILNFTSMPQASLTNWKLVRQVINI